MLEVLTEEKWDALLQRVVCIRNQEIEILRLVAEGYSNRQIAEHLGYSLQSIKRKLLEIFGKLGATNRAHAVALAYKQGLLTE